jgi:hypothetical protein
MGKNIHATKQNTVALSQASWEAGLEVNAEETKYMLVSYKQNTGHHNVKGKVK